MTGRSPDVIDRRVNENEGPVAKEKFLTVRWNNWISLFGGLTFLIYVIVVLATPVLSATAAFVGVAIICVLY